MAEWFFRKKSKGEVERDPDWDEFCQWFSHILIDLANNRVMI